IIALEYFFDTDPGFGNANSVSVSPSTDIANLNIATNIAPLSTGVHQLYIRSKDANQNWSITNRSFFYKLPSSTSSTSNIIALEYFFDNDPGFGNATPVTIIPSPNLSTLNLNIDFTGIPLGPHILFVRSKDDEGNWSITNSVPIEKMQPFDITVFLEGYSDNTGSMANVLFNQGIELNPSNHVDSVLIELHESNYPYSVHSSFTGILKSDGSLIAGAPISAFGQSYYIVIKHRNCIETWSANPILITASTNYNFSDSASKAYGSNQVEIAPNVYALYTGELNADDNIDLLDAALVEADINNFSFGYFASDLNGDGNVDLLDSPILEENLSNFVFANHP
ncbi:MAG TPA: hypothetical protein PLU17_06710, partial [Chitinophagaceae bacterium]|nr:hypothetical protein [Chitinophagaceae bacterium]